MLQWCYNHERVKQMNDIQVYTTDVRVDIENKSVVVCGVEIGDLIGQLHVNDILEALVAADQFSAIADFVARELKEDE